MFHSLSSLVPNVADRHAAGFECLVPGQAEVLAVDDGRTFEADALARMKNHVGIPEIFEGKRFFPLTGTPIPKMLFSSTLLEDCEPEPFTVATLMLKSLLTRLSAFNAPCFRSSAKFPVAIWPDSLPKNCGVFNSDYT